MNRGAITLQGIGFCTRAHLSPWVLATTAGQILVAARSHGDGPQNITITAPVTLAALLIPAWIASEWSVRAEHFSGIDVGRRTRFASS